MTTIVGSKAVGRQVTCYPSGRAVFRFWYETLFGPNSAAYERAFPSQADAVTAAEAWIAEKEAER